MLAGQHQDDKRMTTESNRERILKAALACFDRFGISKTTMEDVAAQAELGRKTVYRTFPGRTALLEAVALQKLQAFAAKLAKLITADTSFEEAFLTISLKSVELARKDPLFLNLLENTGENGGVDRFVVVADSPIAELMRSIWAETLRRGRATGQIRKELDDGKLLTWFRDVQYIMLIRDDLDHAGQEELLRSFVLPALLSAGTLPK